MPKRVIGTVVLVAVLAIVLWRALGARNTSMTHTTVSVGSGTVGPTRTTDPTTGVPVWFGARGIEGRRIAGIVLGEDGAPVRGATVRLTNAFTSAGLFAIPSKITDDAGRFDFGTQPASPYAVIADMPKLTAALERIDTRDSAASPPADQLRLVLHACTASIHGTVFDMAEGTIGGAVVSLYDSTTGGTAGIEADERGAYELCVPPGGADVLVSADGYAVHIADVTISGRTRRDFQLLPGTSIEGRVVRGDDKRGVEGAVIELRTVKTRDVAIFIERRWASSGPDGRFHIEGVSPGRHAITARSDRLATKHAVEVVAELGAPSTDVVCEVTAAFSVSGRLVDRSSGKPVAGRTVSLRSRRRSNPAPETFSISQDDGGFMIDRVVDGEYDVRIGYQRDGVSRSPVEVAGSDVTGLVIEIDAGVTISGRVLAAGHPVDGALVWAGKISTTSGAGGNYTLRGVRPGPQMLEAQSLRLGAFTRNRAITVAAGEDRTGVDLDLDLAGSISGVVVDHNDVPVPGVFLSFSLEQGDDFGSATTDDDGAFTARALSGGGTYEYEVRQRDGSALSFEPAVGERFPPIAVADGSTHVTGVRVRIRFERHAISGQVTDSVGTPVADALVRAEPTLGGSGRGPAVTTNEDGGFTIRDLPAGTYVVNAVTGRGEATVDDVAAGRTDVVLRIVESGGIDGTLVGFTATPDVWASRVGKRYSYVPAKVSGSTFRLRNLRPGSYTVSVNAGTQYVRVSAEVTSGAIKPMTIAVDQGGTIIGAVRDARTHAPLSSLSCVSTLEGDLHFSSHATSDANGAFRIERVPAGSNEVRCVGSGGDASGKIIVATGKVARIELEVR